MFFTVRCWVRNTSRIQHTFDGLAPFHFFFRYLIEFLTELIVQTRKWKSFTNVPFVVVMSPKTNTAFKMAINTVRWKDRVQLLLGSVMDPNNLDRALVEDAEAVFVMADRTVQTIERSDAESILRTWTIFEYLQNRSPNVPIFVQILDPINKGQFKAMPTVTVLPVYQVHRRCLKIFAL